MNYLMAVPSSSEGDVFHFWAHFLELNLKKGEGCGKKGRQCIRGAKTTPDITGNAIRWRKSCLPEIFSGAGVLFVDGGIIA